MAKVVGGAAGPHSPVVYKLPWPESPEYVSNMERLRQCYVEVGKRMRELGADTLLVFGADHVQTFWFGSFPQMMLFTGEEADYAVGGNKLMRLKANPELAEELLFGLVDEGFDVGFSQEIDFFDHPFTVPVYWILKGVGDADVKVVPFHVNTNVHPRVKPRRCYELGRAVRRVLERSKRPDRVFVIGTGGLSHYPGTPYYGTIDEEADRYILEMMRQGKFSELSDVDYDWLDATGNHELGSWLAAAGAVDARSVEVMIYWPAWNNGYSVVWFVR
jgi:aromatic ring-opening dioxygenase catalytic subunit (LigB family)